MALSLPFAVFPGEGLMPAFFPEILPEEAFFSAVARYEQLMQFRAREDLAENLFGAIVSGRRTGGVGASGGWVLAGLTAAAAARS